MYLCVYVIMYLWFVSKKTGRRKRGKTRKKSGIKTISKNRLFCLRTRGLSKVTRNIWKTIMSEISGKFFDVEKRFWKRWYLDNRFSVFQSTISNFRAPPVIMKSPPSPGCIYCFMYIYIYIYVYICIYLCIYICVYLYA